MSTVITYNPCFQNMIRGTYNCAIAHLSQGRASNSGGHFRGKLRHLPIFQTEWRPMRLEPIPFISKQGIHVACLWSFAWTTISTQNTRETYATALIRGMLKCRIPHLWRLHRRMPRDLRRCKCDGEHSPFGFNAKFWLFHIIQSQQTTQHRQEWH